MSAAPSRAVANGSSPTLEEQLAASVRNGSLTSEQAAAVEELFAKLDGEDAG